LTTLKVGGPADALIRPASRNELIDLVGRLTAAEVPWRVIGGGSNILVADQGVEGVVIVLGRSFSAIQAVAADGGRQVVVEAGCALARLSSWCHEQALSGMEFVTGIPGTVGGAIMMNAGASGGEIAQVITEVELLDHQGQLERRALTAHDFCYRGWRHPHAKVVVTGTFTLHPAERAIIGQRCHQLALQRREKQPKGVASAGSFFRNPPGDAAGRLIEQAGLKGLTIGGAQVSEVHANFLVNTGQARAADLLALMRQVQGKVQERFGITLEPEVEFMGRWLDNETDGGR
jgi:UDP-N-acetylmuramate dehydrogenase